MNDTEHPDTARIIPVVEEELVAEARPVKTGSVRVQKYVEKRSREIELPLLRENVDVKRVAINRVVEEEPPIRKLGDTIIVPVVEEELVITKRLVLKEELHIVKHRSTEHAKREVTWERERAEVQRLDAQGRVVSSSSGERKPQLKTSRRPTRPPSLLGR
jgi:uncharacterized protein (TIGR02271 family)